MENNAEEAKLKTADELPQSKVFKMGGGRFVAEMMFRYGAVWMLSLFLLALAGIVVGITVDWRWIVVGLMVAFLIIPMAMTFMYYNYGLRKECFVNTMPHKVIVSERGLRFQTMFSTHGDEEDEAPVSQTSDYEFGYDELLPFTVGNKSVTFRFADKRKGFLWIPCDAYDEPEDFADVLRYIDTKTVIKP